MRPLEYSNGILKLIDQTLLPTEFVIRNCTTYQEAAAAIKDMIVRGAPAIGVTAAYGISIGADGIQAGSKDGFFKELEEICRHMKSTRPTAVNLFWAVDRVWNKALSKKNESLETIRKAILEEASLMEKEDIEVNRAIGRFGGELIKKDDVILTHCNAGALATADYGTALGVVRTAHEQGKNIKVIADETRPYLQGARLTAWELRQDGIPVTLICDNMAGYMMRLGRVSCVIVGADRVTLNGDVANKIGTYSVAVLAKENNIPFYVAAPISTIDFTMESGDRIPIEERSAREITHIKDIQIAPSGIPVFNPAFDVTPNRYVTALITEKGIVRPPYRENILKLK